MVVTRMDTLKSGLDQRSKNPLHSLKKVIEIKKKNSLICS